MSDFLKSLYRAVFADKKKLRRVVMLGLDAAGKTTILYQMKEFSTEVITTIPTIGFNVEEVKIQSNSITCWDVGGCDKIRPLWEHYLCDIDGLIFTIDSNDAERIEDAKIELEYFLNVTIGCPLLVLANKQDLPHAMSVNKIIDNLNLNGLKDRKWVCFGTIATDKKTLNEPLDWLSEAMKDKFDSSRLALQETKKSSSDTIQPQSELVIQATADLIKQANDDSLVKIKESIIHGWLTRDDVVCDDDFIESIKSYTLDNWDHYTHIRIAYVLIKRYGIEFGFKQTENMIKLFIENSSRTNGKSFHRTMTRFWCHIIANAMVDYGENIINNSPHEKMSCPDYLHDFKAFLTIAVDKNELWNGKLFSKYYSNKAIFDVIARENIIQPDLQALPWVMSVQSVNNDDVLQREIHVESFVDKEHYWKQLA
eukprot:gene6649-9127_t